MTQKYRLLVISDSESSLQNIRNVVRHHAKLKPEFAAGGSRALVMISESEPFQIIISDLAGGDVGTVDVLKVARSRSEQTRVVVISGFGDQQQIINAIKSGVHGYLHKPFRTEELNLMLNNLTDHFKLQEELQGLRDTVDALKSVDQEKLLHIPDLEQKIAAMRKELRRLKPPEEEQTELQKALSEAALQRVGEHYGYKVFQELGHLNTLREENKISEEEYREFRKSVLDKAYQQKG
ncbi:MAG: response regulator [Acidobacteriota bacterium]|nr:response regulator [Acidobacteriota bacterium]